MSALEWLDEVRADLDAATDGPWRWRNTEEPLLVGARSRIVMAFSRMGTQRAQPEFRATDGLLEKAGKANLNAYPDASLIASTPDRLDRMERALRGVMELHRPIEVEPSDTICAACSNQLPNGWFLPVVEWPCPTVATIKEALE